MNTSQAAAQPPPVWSNAQAHLSLQESSTPVPVEAAERRLTVRLADTRVEASTVRQPLTGYLRLVVKAEILNVAADSLVQTVIKVFGSVEQGPSTDISFLLESQGQPLHYDSTITVQGPLQRTYTSFSTPTHQYELLLRLDLKRYKFAARGTITLDSVKVELGRQIPQEECRRCRRLLGEPLALLGFAIAIQNGIPAKQGELGEVVAVAGLYQPRCSGTLIAPNLVLSVSHCSRADRVYLGNRFDSPGSGRVIGVKRTDPTPGASTNGDVPLLLWLANPVPVTTATARPLAKSSIIDNAAFGLIAGFGQTGGMGYGKKHHGSVNVLSRDCLGTIQGMSTSDYYKCREELEIVASGTKTNTCYGDSGGPLLIPSQGQYYLAGITSQSWKDQPGCKGGTIFLRVDRPHDGKRSWLERVLEQTL